MELYRGRTGVVIRVTDVETVSGWICDNLLFEEAEPDHHVDYRILINGDCVLYIVSRENGSETKSSGELTESAGGIYHTGLAHVALHAAQIEEALSWCKGRNLNLVLDGKESFYNPGVFGGGERYFNILAPFGVIFEVSEQIDNPVKQEERPIKGLDHLGIPCADIRQEMRLLQELGFRPLFDTVYNYNEAEGHIICNMVWDGAVTLEVYQFTDRTSCRMNPDGALAGIAYEGVSVDSPGGVHFIGTL